jgi:cellobiose-specific phosphotransferase system component IIC
VWGVISIVLSMAVWWPFARAYERRRLAQAFSAAPASASTPEHRS